MLSSKLTNVSALAAYYCSILSFFILSSGYIFVVFVAPRLELNVAPDLQAFLDRESLSIPIVLTILVIILLLFRHVLRNSYPVNLDVNNGRIMVGSHSFKLADVSSVTEYVFFCISICLVKVHCRQFFWFPKHASSVAPFGRFRIPKNAYILLLYEEWKKYQKDLDNAADSR